MLCISTLRIGGQGTNNDAYLKVSDAEDVYKLSLSYLLFSSTANHTLFLRSQLIDFHIRMVNMKLFGATALSLLSATEVMAHPGHNHKAEAVQRRAAVANMSKRSLSHCQEKLAARGVEAKNVQRRHAMHQQLRKTALAKRDFDTVLNTTHHSDLTGITPSTDPATLFVGNNSCILAPETTEGPYCKHE